jgi:thioredoxin 1
VNKARGIEMGKPKSVNWENFENEVLKSDRPVLVDFWAEWCVPCKSIAPVIEELAKEYKGKVIFAKVDVERNPQVAAFLGIRSIPTMIMFSRGEEMERLVGALTKSHIQRKIDHYANK